MKILGFSGCDGSIRFKRREFSGYSQREYGIAQGFDSAAALLVNGQIRAAVAEERFSREKATGDFPVQAIRYCLDHEGLSPDQVDVVAHGFSYEPYAACFGESAYTQRQYEEVFAPEVSKRLIAEAFPGTGLEEKLVNVPHHLSHAASTYYLSGFEDALVLVSDGMGEIHSMTAYAARGGDFEVLRQVSALHSLGILYGVFTLHLGFTMGKDEYKVMGLAPYGNPRKHHQAVVDLVSLKPDGTYAIPLFASNRTLEEKETHRGVLAALAERFGPAREPGSELTQNHMDLAAALQSAFEKVQLHLLRVLQRETRLKNLCLAGGCALNCTGNGAVRNSKIFAQMFVQPASGDDGTSLGAALYVTHQREPESLPVERMSVPLWGPHYDQAEVDAALAGRSDVSGTHYASFDAIAEDVAQRIADGQVVAWYQGRMEFGPRALGSRSILADATSPIMRDKINRLVKKREGFRPFAPAFKAEAATTYFEIESGDEATYEHMLFVTRVRPEYREELPAITHVNGSARVQTVFRQHSPRLWRLLSAVEDKIGVPGVLNTSFNVRGQPIVCTPAEAIDTFLLANLDVLVMENTLVAARPQE